MEIKHCCRCGKDWCFRGDGRPLRCGKCKSPYWDRQFVRGPGNGGTIGETMPVLPSSNKAVSGRVREAKRDGDE